MSQLQKIGLIKYLNGRDGTRFRLLIIEQLIGKTEMLSYVVSGISGKLVCIVREHNY